MNLIYKEDIESQAMIYILEFTRSDMIRVRYHSWDQRLFDDCIKSPLISDQLLALETLARRIEESNADK